MSAILFVIVGIFLFADDKPQQPVTEKAVAEKASDAKSVDPKHNEITTDEKKPEDSKSDDKKSKPKKPKVKEPELRKELLERVKADQEWRNKSVEFSKKYGVHTPEAVEKLSPEAKAEHDKFFEAGVKVDQENTKWLKEVIAKHGWPTFTLVGKDGGGAAWLLTQHADLDPKFQRECLDLMAKLPKTEISKSNFAYLTDRVLLAEGKKQICGTQYTPNAKGEVEPKPIEDAENVNKRRAEMGLESIEKYLMSANKAYGTDPKK